MNPEVKMNKIVILNKGVAPAQVANSDCCSEGPVKVR